MTADRPDPSSKVASPAAMSDRLPPGQQLTARNKWPVVGEKTPANRDDPWELSVAGAVAIPRRYSLAELAAWPPREQVVDIHCVTRWSKLGVHFKGIPLVELLAASQPNPDARFVGFIARSARSHSTSLALEDAIRLGAFVALEAEGEPLGEDHGGPIRIVTPGRYFYKSAKWLERIELLAEDRLGFWEATAGYHNRADPWLQERYMAPELNRVQTREALASRDLSGRNLRSLTAAGFDLPGLKARNALLRDADFRRAKLAGADFEGANLSNAHFAAANLVGASFRSADLEGADFAAADLRGADFTGASLFGASFRGESSGDFTSGARFDATTKIDAAQRAELAPLEASYLEEALPLGPKSAET